MADEMKRDMDLWRKILRSVEARKDTGDLAWVALDSHTDDEISFHVKLLIGSWPLGGRGQRGRWRQTLLFRSVPYQRWL